MPRKNVTRTDEPHSFHHIYTRGHSKRKIFLDEQDYITFLKLLERYLSPEDAHDKYGVPYPNFYNKLELIAFCLMPTHIHLLIYQHQPRAMAQCMQSVFTSYSRYFNTKYHRTGSLFESRYKASLITEGAYVEHISRYIHLVPRQWRTYEYSSLPYYLQQDAASWVSPKRCMQSFETPEAYTQFMQDRADHKKMIDILKQELANV